MTETTTQPRSKYAELIGRLLTADLLRRIEITDGCWLWQGGLDNQRRGRIWIDGKLTLAHRAVWQELNGPIPEGKLLCHHCDNPQCVHPEHLYVGTVKTNGADMSRRKRTHFHRDPERVRAMAKKVGDSNNWAIGEKNPKAKLTERDVLNIRRDPRQTKYVAQDYGVNRTTIQRIRSGKSWAALRAREALEA